MARDLPDPDLIQARRRILHLEHRLETAETLAAAYRIHRPGVGDPQETLLRQLLGMWGRLDHLGDPTRGRSYGTSRGATSPGDRDEGAATRRYRTMKADLNRQIHKALEDCADRIDGTWEPAPRCPRCGRSQRRTARVCDRDGTPLGPGARAKPATPDPEPEPIDSQGLARGRGTSPTRK